MKLLFKNKTKYTKEIYKNFVAFHNKTYNFSYTLYTVLIAILLLFCIILQVSKNNYSLAILFCIAITAFFLWRFFHPISLVSKEMSSDKIQNEKEFTFKFYETYFKVLDKTQYSDIKYYQIYKVYNTKDFFYIYIDRKHAFLIQKENFSVGNSTDFAEFIKKKALFRYRNKFK